MRGSYRMDDCIVLEEIIFDFDQQRECENGTERSLNNIQQLAYNRIIKDVQNNNEAFYSLMALEVQKRLIFIMHFLWE